MSQDFLISLCFISVHLLLAEGVAFLDLRQAGCIPSPSCGQRMTPFISVPLPGYGTALFLRLVQKYEPVLVNNQLDTLFSMYLFIYLFISLLYVFRATQRSSSGESDCVNTSSGIYHSM